MTRLEHLKQAAIERTSAAARGAWQWYRSRPLLTQCVLAAVVAFGAVAVYRYLTAERKED